jgi:hypothetical protein
VRELRTILIIARSLGSLSENTEKKENQTLKNIVLDEIFKLLQMTE